MGCSEITLSEAPVPPLINTSAAGSVTEPAAASADSLATPASSSDELVRSLLVPPKSDMVSESSSSDDLGVGPFPHGVWADVQDELFANEDDDEVATYVRSIFFENRNH